MSRPDGHAVKKNSQRKREESWRGNQLVHGDLFMWSSVTPLFIERVAVDPEKDKTICAYAHAHTHIYTLF